MIEDYEEEVPNLGTKFQDPDSRDDFFNCQAPSTPESSAAKKDKALKSNFLGKLNQTVFWL